MNGKGAGARGSGAGERMGWEGCGTGERARSLDGAGGENTTGRNMRPRLGAPTGEGNLNSRYCFPNNFKDLWAKRLFFDLTLKQLKYYFH